MFNVMTYSRKIIGSNYTGSSYSVLILVIIISKKSSTLIITCLKKQIVSDPPILKAHNNTDIILRLPMGKRIKDIRWLSVWCRRFTKALWTKKIIFAVNMSQFRTNWFQISTLPSGTGQIFLKILV
ncbi:hypothetical protein GQX74_014748 [Glossina fuscipes]|nr:hypothetical protein GQX74_014748 [Glossina fuscipes]